MNSRTPLPQGLYAICDDSRRTDLSMIDKAEQLLKGGVRVLQLRFKRARTADALPVARQIAALCRRQEVLCLINDRVDYTLIAGSDGVHLGEDDLPVAEARRLLGSRYLIGATVRNEQMIDRAMRDGANYVGLGPVFPTATKEVGAAPLGLEGLERIAAASPLPVVAISGIHRGNIAQVAAAGAHAAAVISDLLDAPDIAERARELSDRFARGEA